MLNFIFMLEFIYLDMEYQVGGGKMLRTGEVDFSKKQVHLRGGKLMYFDRELQSAISVFQLISLATTLM